jgi:magnesium-transporting ATPase (P-type)
MGQAGAEAAREAADIVLTYDNFATLVSAIAEGRRIADNVRTFVIFLLSANLGEVALFTVAVAAGLDIPLTVVQILAINVLADGLPAIALSREPARADTMIDPRDGERVCSLLATGAAWQPSALSLVQPRSQRSWLETSSTANPLDSRWHSRRSR